MLSDVGRPSRRFGIAALGLAIALLLACANHLAGALLFLSYGESPAGAEFLTIERAWVDAPDARAVARVKACAVVSLLLCLGAPLGLALATRRRRDKTLFGTARFANRADIRKEKLDSAAGIVLGRHGKDLLRLGGYEFVLLAAPTRTGKGVGFCVPNLLQFQGSAVVLDIKGENYNLTSVFRQRYLENAVYCFNPFAEDTHRWNPLSYVSPDPNFRANDLMALAVIIYPPNEKEPFWPDSARNLFVGLGLLVLETPELPKTIGEILRQGSGKGMPVEEYLAGVLALRAAGPDPLSMACRDSLNRFIGSGEVALKGIVATFGAALTPFANPVIDKATSGDDFDLRDVRRRRMTIYLNIPAGEILQAGFIVNLFFSQLVNENVKVLPEHDPTLRHQCLLLLDEFTAMGKVPIIAKGVGYMAGYNMRLAIVIQDRNQLDAVYGKEDAHNIVSNMGAVIYFTPSQVAEAEEYSKMIGNNTVNSYSIQHAKGSLFGLKGAGGDSTTASYQSRALMLPQELLAMSKDLQLVVRSGIPVIKADKIRYFSDRYFSERFAAVPMHEVQVGGELRRVPLPLPHPRGDWDAYAGSIAASDHYVRLVIAAAADGGAVPVVRPDGATAFPSTPMPLAGAEAVGLVMDDFEPPPAAMPAVAPPAPPAPTVLPASAHPGGGAVPASLPALLADAFAAAIAQRARALASGASLTDGEPLCVLDVRPGDGQFCWQVLEVLRRMYSESPDGLPPLRYIACVADDAALAAFECNPYFEEVADAGVFQAMMRAEVLEARAGSERPWIVIACALERDATLEWERLAAMGTPDLLLALADGEGAAHCSEVLAMLQRCGAAVCEGRHGAWHWGCAAQPWAADAAVTLARALAVPAPVSMPEGPSRQLDWLRCGGHDPQALAQLLSGLAGADWRDPELEVGAWRHALAAVWSRILPSAQPPVFLAALAELALRVGHPGLARESARHALASGLDPTRGHAILARIAEANGRLEEALDLLRRPDANGETGDIERLEQRLAALDRTTWYRPEFARLGPVWVEPLSLRHAALLADRLAEGNDPDCLRQMPAPAAVAPWIADLLAGGGGGAVFLDEDLGLLGCAVLVCAGSDGRLDLWECADRPGQDLLHDAFGAYLHMLVQSTQLQAVLAVTSLAAASGDLLEALGFRRLDTGPAWEAAGLRALCLVADATVDGMQRLAEAGPRLGLAGAGAEQ